MSWILSVGSDAGIGASLSKLSVLPSPRKDVTSFRLDLDGEHHIYLVSHAKKRSLLNTAKLLLLIRAAFGWTNDSYSLWKIYSSRCSNPLYNPHWDLCKLNQNNCFMWFNLSCSTQTFLFESTSKLVVYKCVWEIEMDG